MTAYLEDEDEDDRDDREFGPETDHAANRYAPQIGPAWDPYENHPEVRHQVLQPLLSGDQTALHHVPTALQSGDAAEKLEFLLNLPNREAVVTALAPEEFVFLISEIGKNDAAELLAVASPRQLQACLDLDGWHDDTLDLDRVLNWLAVARSEGIEVLDRMVAAQEDGLLCLALGQVIKAVPIHPDTEDDVPDDVETFDSPDGCYRLYGELDNGNMDDLRAMVQSLYRIDVLRGRAVIRALSSELPSQLEDDLVALRNARLADLGMVGRAEALEIYAYRDPNAFADELREQWRGTAIQEDLNHLQRAPQPYLPLEDQARLGLALRDRETEGSFLGAVYRRLPSHVQERVQTGLLHLAYRVQCARAETAAAVDELPRWSRHALRTLAMGLQHLCDDDLDYAALLLAHVPALQLFRAGHSLVVIEVHRARRLRSALGGGVGLALLEPVDTRLVASLLARHPAHCVGDLQRPFETLAELAATRLRLRALAARVDWVAKLTAGDLPALLEAVPQKNRPRLQALFNTALAWQIVAGRPQLQPLTGLDLREFLGRAFVGGRLVEDLRASVTAAVLVDAALTDEVATSLAEFIDESLDRLSDELGGLARAEQIDVRFVGDALWVTSDLPN
jgi:hypothetical protein